MASKPLRLLILLAFLLLVAAAVPGVLRLRFAFSFEEFLPNGDPDITYYNAHKKKFPHDNSNVIVALYRDAGIFNHEFLEDLDSFCKKARKLPMVNGVTSITNLKDYIYDPNFPIRVKALDFRESEDLKADSVRIMSDPRFVNTFVSESGRLAIVHLSLPRKRPDSLEAVFNVALHALVGEYDFERDHMAGFTIMHYELVTLQQKQFLMYVGVGMLMMFLSMVLVFRRFWGIFVAFLLVFLGMLLFFGLLGWLGRPLDLMATLFPILMVIVGTSDVVHIMTKYVDELNRGQSQKDALSTTLKEIGIATFLTSLTTAVGFLSLIGSRMPPIRNWGLMSAIGVFIAFFTVMSLTFALVSWFRSNQLMMKQRERSLMRSFLTRINTFTRRYPRQIVIGMGLLLLVSAFGASQISLSLTDQRDLPRGSKLLADFEAIDKEMQGLNALNVAIEVSEGHSFYELAIQKELEKLENFLGEIPEVGPVFSPNAYFRIANRAWNANRPDKYHLAEDQDVLDRQRVVLEKAMGGAISSMVSEDGRAGNLYIKVPDVGAYKVREIKAKMDAFVARNVNPELIRFTHTGHRHIFDKNQGQLVWSLMKSLGLAFLLVSLVMALVFRDFKMVIISLIPNVVPLLVAAGLIGFMQFEFDPKVAIVFTVAFGIAVDDSIHFLARFRLELYKGKTVEEAIEATFKETGKAIIITTLILFFGFATLLLSVFPPTYTIGLLLSVTLLVALIADFLLLPVCLRWMLRNHVPTVKTKT